MPLSLSMQILAVFVGGGCGSTARYLVSVAFQHYDGGRFAKSLVADGFPYATLCINVVGSLLIGVITVFAHLAHDAASHSASQSVSHYAPFIPPVLRLALAVGFCGGFTTFSTFSLEMLTLVQAGRGVAAGVYAALSVVACVLGTAGGVGVVLWLKKMLWSQM